MNEITMIRGDTATFDVELVLADASLPDLIDATVEFIVEDLFTKTIEADESTGEAIVTIDPEDTESAPDVRAIYRYNVQVTQDDGAVLTIVRGNFIVLPDVTS